MNRPDQEPNSRFPTMRTDAQEELDQLSALRPMLEKHPRRRRASSTKSTEIRSDTISTLLFKLEKELNRSYYLSNKCEWDPTKKIGRAREEDPGRRIDTILEAYECLAKTRESYSRPDFDWSKSLEESGYPIEGDGSSLRSLDDYLHLIETYLCSLSPPLDSIDRPEWRTTVKTTLIPFTRIQWEEDWARTTLNERRIEHLIQAMEDENTIEREALRFRLAQDESVPWRDPEVDEEPRGLRAKKADRGMRSDSSTQIKRMFRMLTCRGDD